jgi:hypothetical protein
MDNSSKMFLLDSSVLVRDVIVMVVEKFNISEGSPLAVAPYFALYECLDGSTVGNAIAPEEVLVDRVQAWKNTECKLLFMIRLYMPTIWGIEFRDRVAVRLDKPISMLSDEVYLEAAEIVDEELLHIQYIQAIYYVITGQYHTTEAQILKLSALQFFYKFGPYKPNVHKPGFLGERIVEFIPLRHLKETGFDEWERKFFAYVQEKAQYEYQFESKIEAQRKFMDEMYRLDSFGSSFFKASATGLIIDGSTDKVAHKVVLGVHHRGIDIYSKAISRGVFASFSFGELLSWGYSDTGTMYFKLPNVDPVEGKAYETVGRKGMVELDLTDGGVSSDASADKNTLGRIVCDLLTDYTLAFSRESALEDARLGASGRLHDDSGIHADVGPDAIPGTTHHEETIITAPKGVIFSPRAELDKARAMARDNKARMNPIVAVTHIQRIFRGYILRVSFIREGCAEIIQTIWRGYHARLYVSEMIATMLAEAEYA